MNHMNIKRGRAARLLACVAALALALSACQDPGAVREATPTIVPLPPSMPDRASETTATLYFRYLNEPYLISQTRTIAPAEGEGEMKAILDELIKGPSPDFADARAPLDGVTVVDVRESGENIEVTLSKQFRERPKAAPPNWESLQQWRDSVYPARELFIKSIVNTLTEKRHYNVQFFIYEGGDNNRLMLSDIGRKPDGGTDQPVDPMERQADAILTVGYAADAALLCIRNGNMERLGHYIVDSSGGSALDAAALEAALHAPAELRDYQVQGLTTVVNADGQSASVCIQYGYTSQEGTAVNQRNRCLYLTRDRGVWKIEWESIRGLFAG